MVFVKTENDCIMVAKWILGNKKGRRKKRRPKQNGAKKTLGIYKRNKTQNMPPCEELWGDSPSGLAANAPFRSALS